MTDNDQDLPELTPTGQDVRTSDLGAGAPTDTPTTGPTESGQASQEISIDFRG